MKNDFYRSRFFRLLVIYRWVSLMPALLFLAASIDEGLVPAEIILALAVIGNLFVTFGAGRLRDLLVRYPWILLADLVFSVGLLLFSGGGAGPYFMYSFSPLLAAAFFFQVRGGLVASGVYSLLFLIDLFLISSGPPAIGDAIRWTTQIAGVWLVPTVVGALSSISKELRSANEDLSGTKRELSDHNLDLTEAHRQLQTIHDLTRLLQAAPDVRTMQEQVLGTLSQSLQTPRALLGLVKPGTNILHSWRALEAGTFHADPDISPQLPLRLDTPDAPLVREVLTTAQPRHLGQADTAQLHPPLREWLAGQHALLVPLIFHEQPVGILLIPSGEDELVYSGERFHLIKTLANQAATSLGTTMLCVERAQDLAVEQERNRIAREIHDTVSQSLFGMSYSLDACIRMLPANVDGVKHELIELQSLANQTREQVRHSIFDLWPSSLTLDIFQSDLDHYISHCFRLIPFNIHFDINGDFDGLSPAVRRNLYRITQEALTNTLNHAGVDEAWVRMAIEPEALDLAIEDRGVGFDVANALARDYSREHFGLHGIRERTWAMGGRCEIDSEPNAGSRIHISVPLRRQRIGGHTDE